jgi:hypothetical protein
MTKPRRSSTEVAVEADNPIQANFIFHVRPRFRRSEIVKSAQGHADGSESLDSARAGLTFRTTPSEISIQPASVV